VYDYRVTTAVTTEPLSLAEVKEHLRLTSGTLADDTTTYQTITPADQDVVASYGLVGSSVDVLGVKAIVNLNSGTNGSGASVTAKIQESDDDVTYQDFTGGAFTVVTETNDNAIQEIEYTGYKQYIRVIATVAVDTCNFSADVVTTVGEVAEDDLLTALITVAREYCENITSRALATQTIVQYMDSFPCENDYELARPPAQSVTSVIYTDSDGDETTLTANTDYIVDDTSNIGKIVLPYSKTWPTFTPYPVNPIKTTYIAGYYSSDMIPKSIKQAMLLIIGHYYENREAVMTGAINMTKKVEYAVDSLLALYKVRWL